MIIIESRPCVDGAEWKREGEINLSRAPKSFIENDLMRLCALICSEQVTPSSGVRARFEVRATQDGRVLTFVYDNVVDEILLDDDPSTYEPLRESDDFD